MGVGRPPSCVVSAGPASVLGEAVAGLGEAGDGPVPVAELVPLQAGEELQAQQEEPEPVSVAVPGEGAGEEAVQVPGEQAEPPEGVALPLPLQHRPLPQGAGPRQGTRTRLLPAGPH